MHRLWNNMSSATNQQIAAIASPLVSRSVESRYHSRDLPVMYVTLRTLNSSLDREVASLIPNTTAKFFETLDSETLLLPTLWLLTSIVSTLQPLRQTKMYIMPAIYDINGILIGWRDCQAAVHSYQGLPPVVEFNSLTGFLMLYIFSSSMVTI